MNTTVYWRCFLNTQKRTIAEQFHSDVEKHIAGITLQKMEPYWKDSNLMEVEFIQQINNETADSLIISLLNYMKWFSRNWNITIPADLVNDCTSFTGFANSGFKDSKLNWLSISL
jgi:hypothetical protein